MKDKAYPSVRADVGPHEKFRSIAACGGRSMNGRTLRPINRRVRDLEGKNGPIDPLPGGGGP